MAQTTAAKPTVCILGTWGKIFWTQVQYCSKLFGLQTDPKEWAKRLQTYLNSQTEYSYKVRAS